MLPFHVALGHMGGTFTVASPLLGNADGGGAQRGLLPHCQEKSCRSGYQTTGVR